MAPDCEAKGGGRGKGGVGAAEIRKRLLKEYERANRAGTADYVEWVEKLVAEARGWKCGGS
jgi:alpha-L-arabinofuranosidase